MTMTEVTSNALLSSKKLLKEFNTLQKINILKAEKVLSRFAETGLRKKFQKDKRRILTKAESLLSYFRDNRLNTYDIFRKAGFVADENHFSDAIISILDPNEQHLLDIKPLISLLDYLHSRNPKKIFKIKALIKTNRSQIVLHRERHEGDTIPDIEIVCPEFIIFFENKIRGGLETSVDGLWQTKRQWLALNKRRRDLDIPEENVLAIYLTPEGKIPKDEHFISLSVIELVHVLQNAIIHLPENDLKHSMLAFLNYYNWE